MSQIVIVLAVWDCRQPVTPRGLSGVCDMNIFGKSAGHQTAKNCEKFLNSDKVSKPYAF